RFRSSVRKASRLKREKSSSRPARSTSRDGSDRPEELLIMPMYEYSCRACSHVFESLTSARRVEPESCPKCGGVEVERLIALPAAGRIESSAAPTNCR